MEKQRSKQVYNYTVLLEREIDCLHQEISFSLGKPEISAWPKNTLLYPGVSNHPNC